MAQVFSSLPYAGVKLPSPKPDSISEPSHSKLTARESRKGEDTENRLKEHGLVQAGFQQNPYVLPETRNLSSHVKGHFFPSCPQESSKGSWQPCNILTISWHCQQSTWLSHIGSCAGLFKPINRMSRSHTHRRQHYSCEPGRLPQTWDYRQTAHSTSN